ncbi:uncharacterized protein [Triticum aestivum]|uniref:uncharacterized protein n=1 Tax=Triticum aestivum TaxID=4565 RepID=UPI001D010FB7|nr:uncharacterized protein LOC123158000 [Triticum aestivum]
MSLLPGRRLMMMFRRVPFLRICWIVIRHSAPRFSATQLSKIGRKRLANGMFLCLRSDLLLKKRCSKLYALASGKVNPEDDMHGSLGSSIPLAARASSLHGPPPCRSDAPRQSSAGQAHRPPGWKKRRRSREDLSNKIVFIKVKTSERMTNQ